MIDQWLWTVYDILCWYYVDIDDNMSEPNITISEEKKFFFPKKDFFTFLQILSAVIKIELIYTRSNTKNIRMIFGSVIFRTFCCFGDIKT